MALDKIRKRSNVGKRTFTKEMREMAYQTVVDRFKQSAISRPIVDPCKAGCIKLQGTPAYQDCIDNCDAYTLLAEAAERLHKELVLTCLEVIWGGGHIDPIPFEKEVRKRFSRPRTEESHTPP